MAVSGDSLPQVTQGGSVEMTIHQINGEYVVFFSAT